MTCMICFYALSGLLDRFGSVGVKVLANGVPPPVPLAAFSHTPVATCLFLPIWYDVGQYIFCFLLTSL